MMLYTLAFVPLILACGPGTGPITTTPTMRFTFSYPVAWTYAPTTAGPGQSLSQQSAQNRINADIEFAVIKAVESYGYSASGVSVQNAVAPLSITLNAAAAANCAAIGNGVVEGGAVTRKCADATAAIGIAPAFNTTSTITVTSPVALYQSQWQNIAVNVWQSLTTNAGVRFYGLIEVV